MTTLLLSPTGALIDVIQGVVMGLFILCAVLLTIVVLLQEGKGGGIAGAFGGAGGETFGVKAGNVNRFTSYLGFAFLGLALLYAGLQSKSAAPSKLDVNVQTPASLNEAGTPAPAAGASTPEAPGTPPAAPAAPAAPPAPPATPPEAPAMGG
ncbi:MAG: preprotein translocase subunit SecG [Planctomycetia bacterium]